MSIVRHSSSSVRRELVLSTAVLFVGAVLVAVISVALALSLLESPGQAAWFITVLVAAELGILFLFLRWLLDRSVFSPLARIGLHAERIAGGQYDHRIAPEEGEELDRLVRSLNTMAERLITDQEKLAENVRSLDRTNQDLVDTSAELVRTARMASVGTLAAGLAHEVGNPLGALMGNLDVARRRASMGGDLAEPLEMASEEALRIDRIVRSVLDFARPRADGFVEGEADSVRPIASLSRAVNRTLSLLEGRGALEGVEIVLRTGGSELYPVRALPQHLEQVILNLVMNAIQAVKEGEAPIVEIRLRTERIPSQEMQRRRADDPPGTNYAHRRRVALLPDRDALHEVDRSVVLDVLDNGPGVPESDLTRLFDPFYTTRAPGEGTGMGLAITARIVEELGGKIEVRNREEGGAWFSVHVPEANGESGADTDHQERGQQ